jgi:hypothetical protein
MDGFTINVDRVFYQGGKEVKRQTITTNYRPSPKVICGKKPKKEKKEKKENSEAQAVAAGEQPKPKPNKTPKPTRTPRPSATESPSEFGPE